MELVRTVRESEHSRNLRDKLLARHDQLPPLLFQVHFSSPASSRDRAAAAWVVVLGSAVKDARKVPAQRKSSRDLHPLVGALARVDPLAGAPGLNACLLEGEHASSPVGRHWSVLALWGCPEPFFLCCPRGSFIAAPSHLRRKIRLCQRMIGGWSGKNLTLVHHWEKFWNCWTWFGMLQDLLFGTGKFCPRFKGSLVTWRMNYSLSWPRCDLVLLGAPIRS